jgi:hypothetical protein
MRVVTKVYLTILLIAVMVIMTQSGVLATEVAVETYTGTNTVNATMPGTVMGNEIRFSGIKTITSVTFNAGPVDFYGTSVDFAGTEANWIGTYTGSLDVPDLPGQTVTATGSGSVTDPPVNISGTGWASGIQLGTQFAANKLDVLTGAISGASNWALWNSTIVPALNGNYVRGVGSGSILTVDATNGIITASGSGTIYAVRPADIPALSQWGLIILAIGLIGAGALLVNRRRSNLVQGTAA